MTPDNKLIADALRRSGGRKNDDLAELIQVYEISCRLASGPNAARSAHWLAKAVSSRIRLEQRAGYSRKDCEGK